MTNEEMKEIALRFSVQGDRGSLAEAPSEIVNRAQAYFDFLSGKPQAPKKKAKRS